MVIWGWGGFLLFHGLDALPLWLVWTLGPLCWYLGCAVMLVASSMTIHQYLAARSKKRAVAPDLSCAGALRFKKVIPGNGAPAGVTREIPPMGEFVI